MVKVSILLAVYNGALFLDDAVKSIHEQTFQDWELVAVENGSTDNSLQILNKWSEKDPRIKVFSLKEKGKNKAFNYAFSQSKGEYLCYFAADDILHPASIEQRLQPMLHASEISYTTCLLETISEDPKYRGIVFPKNKALPNFSGGSMFFKSDIAKKIFPLPENLPNEDVWSALHLKNFAHGSHVASSLYYYRIHGANSYGYHENFEAKRKGFLVRMGAFKQFVDKYRTELKSEKTAYLDAFSKGKAHAEQKNIPALVLSPLPVKDRLIFIYYCSPLLFIVRKRLFKLLSGKIELF